RSKRDWSSDVCSSDLVAFRLGVDPKKADQQIRGAMVLPHGTGKTRTVLVFAKGDKVKEAEEAGADYVGDQDLINKINQGWFEFEIGRASCRERVWVWE